jgi:hypothetical protein
MSGGELRLALHLFVVVVEGCQDGCDLHHWQRGHQTPNFTLAFSTLTLYDFSFSTLTYSHVVDSDLVSFVVGGPRAMKNTHDIVSVVVVAT